MIKQSFIRCPLKKNILFITLILCMTTCGLLTMWTKPSLVFSLIHQSNTQFPIRTTIPIICTSEELASKFDPFSKRPPKRGPFAFDFCFLESMRQQKGGNPGHDEYHESVIIAVHLIMVVFIASTEEQWFYSTAAVQFI